MTRDFNFKTINELLGEHFYIAHYQRGYRWTRHQVLDLLNDIWSFAKRDKVQRGSEKFYCLQPVVVKKQDICVDGTDVKGWEVIDGQQRLTTIYIILSYLAKEFLKVDNLAEEYGENLFSLQYQTRPGSEDFLKNLTDSMENIDYYYMSQAYKTTATWFNESGNIKDRTDRNLFLSTILGKAEDESSVKVIWYEVSQVADSIELFSRLNIGKIPLTNSELIKALFLSESSFIQRAVGGNSAVDLNADAKKERISVIWDDIERNLSNEEFWAFLTNKSMSDYPNRIELLLDMVAGKKTAEREPLFTFLHFYNRFKDESEPLWEVWLDFEKYYHTAVEWYRNKDLYHKVGYLVSIEHRFSSGVQPSQTTDLQTLISKSLDMRKDDFEDMLDGYIRDSIKFDIDNLTYDTDADRKKIENVLLLFNIESMRNNASISSFYPFKFHKNVDWSLEHIHAQNSEDLGKTKKQPWLEWLASHREIMVEIMEEASDRDRKTVIKNLIEQADRLNEDKITWESFNDVAEKIIHFFSVDEDNPYHDVHHISNLALIEKGQNSRLSNSVFEVKRREIIKMDMEGKYIPIGTRRVFLRYYNPEPVSEPCYYWGASDREYYLEEIKTVLKASNYLYESNATEE